MDRKSDRRSGQVFKYLMFGLVLVNISQADPKGIRFSTENLADRSWETRDPPSMPILV